MGVRTQVTSSSLTEDSAKIKEANLLIPLNLQWQFYVASLVISDAFMTFLAYWLAYDVRFVWFVQFFDSPADISFEQYRLLLYTMPLVWLVIFLANGLYMKESLLGGTLEYSRVLRSASEGFLLIVLAGFLQPTLIFARGWLLLTWGISFLLVAGARFGLRRFVYSLRKHGYFITPAVIVGANQEGRWLAEQLLRWETSGLRLVGFVDKKEPVASSLFHGLPALGSVDDLGEIIEKYHIREVVLASSAYSTRDHLLEIFRRYGVSDQIKIRMSSGLYEILTTGLTINEFAYVPLVQINKVRLVETDSLLKLSLDYLGAALSVVILSPLLLLISLCVRITSPGPVLEKRPALGLNGKQFQVLKFRTMLTDGDEILKQHPELKKEWDRNHKLKNDPRLTPIGAFLRRYRLDSLPNLFNVLKGDMSLVGPRPIFPEQAAIYEQYVMNLLTILPGITGLRQISNRSNLSYEERVRLDMYYVRNWSIWLDLQLIIQTVIEVLKGRESD